MPAVNQATTPYYSGPLPDLTPPFFGQSGINIPLPHSNGLALTVPWWLIAGVAVGGYLLFGKGGEL